MIETPSLKNKKTVLKASLLIALSGFLYGFLGYFGTKVLQENISVSAMLFWRFFIAGMTIFIIVFKNHFFYSPQKKQDNANLFAMFILGALGYAGASGFYFIAAQSLGTGLSMVIFFSYPIMVVFFSWMIHRQRFQVTTLLCLIGMMIGLCLLPHQQNAHIHFYGIIWGVLSALAYTLYVMGTKKYATFNMNPNFASMMVCFGAAMVFLIRTILSHTFAWPTNVNGWLFLLALSILSTVIPIQLMLHGLKHISSVRASIISVLEPLVTLFVGIILLGETISQNQIFGVILLLASTLCVQLQREL
jgi:drug/metabolite transporter (DMT)-like permease